MTSPSELWDSRFSEPGFAYGSEPNAWFREQILKLPPGRILLPAEGQGRNAVFAAGLGWEVDAFDTSREGRARALELARLRGVRINYELHDLRAFTPEPGRYDAVALVYVHVPTAEWKALAHRIATALRPGGVLIAEVFSKRQLGRPSGGPKDIDQLFDPSHFDLPGLARIFCEEMLVDLDEGKYHRGEASVVRALLQRQGSSSSATAMPRSPSTA